MNTSQQIIRIITATLQLNNSEQAFSDETPLLGGIPEFDSMAVVSVIEAIENQFGIMIDEDEISAELFETIGSLTDFVEKKL